jgi:hypothetical protein
VLRFVTESRFANGRVSRRDLLRLGGLAGLQLAAPAMVRGHQGANAPRSPGAS